MELMISLLLCVLVALVPQASEQAKPKPEMKFNNSISIQQKPKLHRGILHLSGRPMVNSRSGLQTVFSDKTCYFCFDCMERALKAERIKERFVHYSNEEDYRNDNDVILNHQNEVVYRIKRNSGDPYSTKSALSKIKKTKATMKRRPRRYKTNKSVTVTKYNMGGKVYALRVKETQVTPDANNDTRQVATCQVYNVKKSFACDSIQSDALLAQARRKAAKRKARRQDEKIKSKELSTTQTTHLQTAASRKREVDNSHVPETYMPSIEDLYS